MQGSAEAGGLEPDDVEGRLHFLGRLYIVWEVCFLLVGVIAALVGNWIACSAASCFFWFGLGKPIAALGIPWSRLLESG
jgi:hypothetical protein